MNSRISTEYGSIESRLNFTNFHTVSYIIWTPLWTKCASAAAILSNISADGYNTSLNISKGKISLKGVI